VTMSTSANRTLPGRRRHAEGLPDEALSDGIDAPGRRYHPMTV
jgi:hypothetical protein